MDDRIHRILDGDEPIDGLSAAERQELDAYRTAIQGATDAIRSSNSPDLTFRVMASIDEAERVPVGGSTFPGSAFVRWLLAPRPVSLAWRPVYALAVALVAVVIGVAGWELWPDGNGLELVTRTESVAPAKLFVQFRLEAPGAASVAVTGSFTNWADGVAMVETTPGVFSTLLPLEPGVHDYSFIVDGEVWVLDPTAPAIDDGFGGSKNRLFLTEPRENA